MSSCAASFQEFPKRERSPLPRIVIIRLLASLALVVGLAATVGASGQEAQASSELPYEGRLILRIDVIGEQRYTEERLRAALGLSVGDLCSAATVEEGIEYLWSLFQVRASLDYRLMAEGVELRLVVTELPADLEPRFIGNVGVNLEKLLEWAQLEDRRELFLHQVPRVTTRVLEGYKREGYYFAEVNPVIRELQEGDDPNAPGDVIFEIIEGPQVHVKKVLIEGNESLPEGGFWFWKDGLSAQASILLAGPGLFDWSGTEFVLETLRGDLLAMRKVYRDSGYLNAVVELDRLEFSEDRSGVEVHIIIDEGEAFVVRELFVQAFSLKPNPRGSAYLPLEEPTELVLPEEEILQNLSLAPGKVYTQRWVRSDHQALRDLYGKDGHIEHPSLGLAHTWRWLEPELIFDMQSAEVDVIYRIAEGQPVRIREVIVAGATHTQDRIIRRELSVMPGELADMKEIRSSLRRLTSSNYFTDDRNRLEHRDPAFRFIPTGEEGLVDIEFIVEEGRVVDMEIAAGVDSNDGLFGIVALTMRNFDITSMPSSFLGAFGEIFRKEALHGAGQTMEIEISPGSTLDRSRIRFVEPDIFRRQQDRIALDLEISKVDRILQDYDEKRIARRVKFGYTLGFNSSIWLGFANQDLTISDVDEDVDLTDPLLQPLADQVGSSSLTGLTLDWRHRDTDVGFNPRDGRILSWKNEFYSKSLGSDWELYKSKITWDEYLPLAKGERDVHSVVRISMGAAVALPFGDSDLVPFSERFFLGGFSSLRGFRYRGAGPSTSSGTPIGGESMLRVGIEYRYPLHSITRPGTFHKTEMLRAHLFMDAGLLGTKYDQLDFGDTRASVGFGFGLMYPLPIVFNFGFPIREGEFDRKQVFSFNLAIR